MNDIILFDQFAKGKKQLTVKTNNCVIYTRVSTKEQADNNMSLETQRKMCEQCAQKNKYTILGYFGGTYESAKTDERKEFSRMLHFVKNSREKISYIIVYSVDRFSRSGGNAIYITENLKKQGVIVLSVTQPTDTSTPSGSLQQNIQFIFSEYDNQLRKEKCMSGVKEALLRGEWCHKPPFGYDIVKRDGKRMIVINEKGKKLKKAFLWKAEGVGTEEVRKRLAALGIKFCHQSLSNILRNPFYCGLMSHNALEGKLVEGNHEKLITREVFLKVNEVIKERTHGYTFNFDNDDLPLKNFLKCDQCGSNMPGYLVRRKKLWYYKCRMPGCSNNKSAKRLHETFTDTLLSMTFDSKYNDILKAQMIRTYNRSNKSNHENTLQMNRHLQDVTNQIDRLEERFVKEEISQDLFQKYQDKFKEESRQIQDKLQKSSVQVSNLEECADTVINYAVSLRETWDSADYKEKVRLQYLLFPEGIRYNKKTNKCRTTKIKRTFLWMLCNSKSYSKKKVGIPQLNLRHTNLVEPGRFELPSKQGTKMLSTRLAVY